ncbi:MAG: D-tyrosyl-tRNA(Tyr) deacylase [Chitinophagales bacterium]|jgi:D-tyrosyl-tRNA(Tyr) deacylase
MKAIIQRVSEASVQVNAQTIGAIQQGLLVLLGFENEDQQEDIDWMVQKIIQMRIFNDAAGKMNLSLLDVSGDILLISQFTLHASTKKGNRPSFIKAAKPDMAIPLYEQTISSFQHKLNRAIQTGEFGADMKVSLLNDGPVTISLDSKLKY